MYTCTYSCEASSTEQWWNSSQILAANGLSGEKGEGILEALLADNRAQFGHQFQSEESLSRNPILTKYFWIEDHGVQRSVENRESKTLSSSSDLKEKEVQGALKDAAINLQMVKSENPRFAEFLQKLAVAQSAKSSLEKLTGQASDLYFQLKGATDKVCQGKAPEIQNVLLKMNEHLSQLREMIAEHKKVDASDNKIPERIQQMAAISDVAMAHQDGFKSLKKRCLAMLG